MVEIHVKITGPGGVISVEAEMIRQALTEMGCKVVVNDPHSPGQCYIGNAHATLEEVVANYRKGEKRNTFLTIDLNHKLWGG